MDTDNSRRSNFIVQGSILAVASIISRIVGMLYRVPLKAIIGKVGNDYYGTAFEVYSIVLIISCYSIPLAVSKLVAARLANKRMKDAYMVLRGAVLFAILSGGAASAIIFFGADFFAEVLKTPYAAVALKCLWPVPMVVALVGVFRGFFQGQHTMLPSAVSQIIEQIVNAVVSIVAAYFLFSYGSRVGAVIGDTEGIAAAYGAAGGTIGTGSGAVAALIFIVLIYLLYRRRLRRKVLRDHSANTESLGSIMVVLFLTIVPVLLSTTLYNVSSIIDQWIFKDIAYEQLYTSRQISEWWGVYTGQYKVLINVPISIASAMAASSVPSLTEAFNSDNPGLVRRRIHTATRFIMVIAFPCAIGMAVLSKPIMMLLFQDPENSSAIMLILGAVAIVFYSLSTLSNGLLQGIDRMRIPVMNAVISLVLQALLLVFLMRIFKLHIYAVIIANAFYAFLMCLLNGFAVRRYSGTKQNFFTTYLIPAVAAGIMGVIVFVIYRIVMLFGDYNAIATIISIVVGACSYFIVLLMLHGVSEQELYRFPKGDLLVDIAKRLHLL